MRQVIKNNVLPYTLTTVTLLVLSTWDMEVKSISALWYTDLWLVYVFFVMSNGLLFLFGDNQTTNKVAGILLMIMLLYPISSPQEMMPNEWTFGDWIHHISAAGFFFTKALNHHKYDAIYLLIGAMSLVALDTDLYLIEIVGLYILLWQGFVKKRNYFKRYRAQLSKMK